MAVSRRQFLSRVGAAGGYGAAFTAMQGLGLLPGKPLVAQPVSAPQGIGNGKSVAVLGGGIAGLVAAYELRALGYTVTLLEARMRPGGRNWTVRGGDSFTLLNGITQHCAWDAGNYQNFGPARLPSIHSTMLGYCRTLGVEMQVEVNMSRSAHLQDDDANGGRPAIMRQVENDARGHVSELLMKCVNQGALDAELTALDRDRIAAFLGWYGPLNANSKYIGSDRAGYAKLAGAGDDAGVRATPIPLSTLLDDQFWQGIMFDEAFDMQATMFQPVGGMDRIPFAFAKALGNIAQYGAAVTAIRSTGTGVRIEYTQHGAAKELKADYGICALPLTVLKKIPNDFAASHQKVIAQCTYAGAYKIAWESRRFWEQDDNVYGGLEFCNVGCSPIWFPSAGMFAERGVAVSGYTDETQLPDFAALTLDGKFAESRKSMERLHPGRGHELEKPMYVGWSHVEHNEGSWIRTYGPNEPRQEMDVYKLRPRTALAPGQSPSKQQSPGIDTSKITGAEKAPESSATHTNPSYEALIQPDDRFIFAGDHVSHIVGWQEGAALSALRAVAYVNDRVKAAHA